VAQTALTIAVGKGALPWEQAFIRGIFCNALVCLAVWLGFSARTTTDKILCIVFPITAFVAAGFEHSIANMYFLPYALFVKSWTDVPEDAAGLPDLSDLTWGNAIFGNLVPVTIGNVIGGAVLVGAVYWLAYLRSARADV